MIRLNEKNGQINLKISKISQNILENGPKSRENEKDKKITKLAR